MGWEDRDYNREDRPYGPRSFRGMGGGGGVRFGSRLTGSSVVTWLLVANVIIFLFDNIVSTSQRAAAISPSLHGYAPGNPLGPGTHSITSLVS